jgi:adenosyl cobinamide kinase/adenosyl cobinamide phosphate guanylyltransferase
LFIQEKSFDAALDQEIALDKKFNLDQKNIFKLAQICRKNKAFTTALKCYDYILSVGTDSPYFLESQLEELFVKNQILASNYNTKDEEWEQLATDYTSCLNRIGKTSYTILLLKDLAEIMAFRLYDVTTAKEVILEALNISSATDEELAKCKLVFADILLLQNEIWEAIIYYSQVDKSFKHDVLGHEAKYRRAKISYYQGDFDWAQAQLDVLKKSTSKLIANNAMDLSLLIQDNLNLDTTTTTMEIFARADLNTYQNKFNLAFMGLDSIIIDYSGHSLVDEALYKQYEIKMMQGEKEDASELLDQIINFYAYDILADDAKFAQAQLQEYYFNDLNYALKLYEDIMLNHKDSFYLAEARKRYRELNLNSE